MSVSFFHTVQSFSQFLWNWVLSGGNLVDQNTANIRAGICASCHNNLPSSEVRKGGCSTCNKMGNYTLEKVRDTIIKGHRTTNDSKLLTCGLCGCDNRISVWIPNVVLLNIEDANAYPEFCYKKKRLENLDV